MHSRYDGYSFPLRNTVTREKVRFHNRYGIELAGDLYLPREVDGKLAAVAVSGPFGAVKEQCSGLYAEELAARGSVSYTHLRPRSGRSSLPEMIQSPPFRGTVPIRRPVARGWCPSLAKGATTADFAPKSARYMPSIPRIPRIPVSYTHLVSW